jgi:hypothetical protein
LRNIGLGKQIQRICIQNHRLVHRVCEHSGHQFTSPGIASKARPHRNDTARLQQLAQGCCRLDAVRHEFRTRSKQSRDVNRSSRNADQSGAASRAGFRAEPCSATETVLAANHQYVTKAAFMCAHITLTEQPHLAAKQPARFNSPGTHRRLRVRLVRYAQTVKKHFATERPCIGCKQALLEADKTDGQIAVEYITERPTGVAVQATGDIQRNPYELSIVCSANRLRCRTIQRPGQACSEQGINDNVELVGLKL